MDETINMKLKKPAGNEYISVETINGNMDIIDAGMKEISDSVDAPEFDASGNVGDITDKASLLASFVTKMSLVKFMRNVVAGFKLVLYAGQVVNNCVTDNAGLPLSAAQGKVLMDLYTVLNTKIIYVDTPSVPITASAGQSWFADIPFTKQDGYIPISATINCTGGNSQAYIIGIHQLTNGSVRVAFQNYSGSPQTINISAKVVLIKQT